MAEKNIGKITQVISAVLDIKFPQGGLPEINDAIEITTKDGGVLTVEVAQHLGDDTVRCIALGPTDGLVRGMDAAIENYTKAIEYKAFPPEMGYMFLGMAYSNKGAWQEADDCYQRVIDRFVADGAGNSPLLIDTYTNKAVAASQLGKHEEAHLLCKKAKKIQPDDPGIHLAEGKLYMKEGQKKKAVKAFDKALVMEPSAEMWYLVASAYSDTEYLYQAKLCFEESYRIDPNYADVTEKLSILSLMHNEIDDFFKYNSESAHPISEDIILDLLSRPNQTEEGEQMLKEVWKRMKKEKGNK